MDLRLLETFQAVLDHGSINAAATHLGYAQSTVTQHVQQLEQQVGVELFHREGKRLRISEGGKMLQKHAEGLLLRASEIRAALQRYASGAGGAVRVGCVEPFANTVMPRVLRKFLHEPNAIDLTLEVSATHSLFKALSAGDLDLAIAPPPRGHTDITFEPLFFERLAFLTPRSHPLATKNGATLEDFMHERLIVSGPMCEYRIAFERSMENVRVRPESTITITAVEARKTAAQAGLGIALVPVSAARPLPSNTVLRIPAGEEIGVVVGLARRSESILSPTVERLAQLLREEMAQRKRLAVAE